MIKATFNYSSDLVQSQCFEIEMSRQRTHLLDCDAMQLRFQFRDQQTGAISPLGSGTFEGYSPWSESAERLVMRTLYTLYSKWVDLMPNDLVQGRVASIAVDLSYVLADRKTKLLVASASPAPGTSTPFFIHHSMASGVVPAMELTGITYAPLGMALCLLAFQDVRKIEFDQFPQAPSVPVRYGRGRPHTVSLADVPEYARKAFTAFLEASGEHPDVEGFAPLKRWHKFLKH